MSDEVKIRKVILAMGIMAILFELLLPPLRSPSPNYATLQLVDQHLVAIHISRFSLGALDSNSAKLKDGTVIRTEVDGGELLRELAFLVVVFGTVYLLVPTYIGQELSKFDRK